MKKIFWVMVILLNWHWDAAAYRLLTRYRCLATAYAQSGITRLGTLTHRGIVAADPRVFPLGTRIRVTGAGPYSGTYVVTDTGGKVLGRHIDIFIPEFTAARRFGRKTVLVSVIEWGDPDA
jgi:3D (Asp-Asp-Asp) domain-containing protein